MRNVNIKHNIKIGRYAIKYFFIKTHFFTSNPPISRIICIPVQCFSFYCVTQKKNCLANQFAHADGNFPKPLPGPISNILYFSPHTPIYPPIIFYTIKHNPLFRVVAPLPGSFFSIVCLQNIAYTLEFPSEFTLSSNTEYAAKGAHSLICVWICTLMVSTHPLICSLLRCEHEHMCQFFLASFLF